MGLTSQGQELESHSKCSEVSPDWTKGRTRGSGGAIEAGGHAHLTWYFQPNVTLGFQHDHGPTSSPRLQEGLAVPELSAPWSQKCPAPLRDHWIYLSHLLKTQPRCPHLQEAFPGQQGPLENSPGSLLRPLLKLSNSLRHKCPPGLSNTPGPEPRALTPAQEETDWTLGPRSTHG